MPFGCCVSKSLEEKIQSFYFCDYNTQTILVISQQNSSHVSSASASFFASNEPLSGPEIFHLFLRIALVDNLDKSPLHCFVGLDAMASLILPFCLMGVLCNTQ